MVTVTHYNPATAEALTTVHGPSDPDRREWAYVRAVRFVAEAAPAGTDARYEFRADVGRTRILRIHGRA